MTRAQLLGAVGMALALVLMVGAISAGEVGDDEAIRVGLRYGDSGPESVTISGCGDWHSRRHQGGFEGDIRLSAGRGELVLEVGERRGGVGPWMELRPTGEDAWLVLEGRAYRGSLRVEVQRNGRLKVVNVMGVEDYVRGVVPNEIFADGEAYKVQAVISRTFGVYVRDIEKKHAADGFDICTTGHCQVYGGADTERAASDEAVEATRGEVLTYRGKPIFSAYHANAGGLTQPVDEAWPGSVRRDFAYLQTVTSPYDAAARELPGFEWCYRWRRVVGGEEVRERLRAQGQDVGEVQELVVKGKTSTGRVCELEVVGTRGRARVRTPAAVRAVLGTPSARLEAERCDGGEFAVNGWGRGHGVGLSQHGALGMAKAGYGYEEILGHFYTGVELVEDYGRGTARALRPPSLDLEVEEVVPAAVPPGMS